MNEIEKEKAESFSLLALSLLEIVVKQEFNNSWNERFENLFNSSQVKVIHTLENYILKAENTKDGITLNFPEGTDNLRLLISEVVKNNFNTFKNKFKNKNYE
jgi:hypothetical protein